MAPDRCGRLTFDDLDERATRAHPDNPKLHDLSAIDSSFSQFGYVAPVIERYIGRTAVRGEG